MISSVHQLSLHKKCILGKENICLPPTHAYMQVCHRRRPIFCIYKDKTLADLLILFFLAADPHFDLTLCAFCDLF